MEGSFPQSIFSMAGAPLKWVMEWAFKLLHLEGFPETISLCIVLGMIFFIARCWLGLRTLNTGIQSCSNALGRIDPTEKFFDNSQEVESAVNNSPQSLRDCWNKFRATLVEHRTSVFLTTNPIDFFNINTLGAEVTLRKLSKWSGLFVGIGLLFTFLGLVAALSEASNAIKAATASLTTNAASLTAQPHQITSVEKQQSASLEQFSATELSPLQDTQRNKQESIQIALKNLLSAATFKFYTSIFGLLASLVVSYSEKRLRNNLERNANNLCLALEHALPPITSEQLLAEQVREAQETSTQLKQFNGEMREGLVQLSGAMEKSLLETVGPVQQELTNGFSSSAKAMHEALHSNISPVKIGIDQLSENIGSMEHAISRTIGENLQAMQEKTLSTLAEKLGTVVNDQAGAELGSLTRTLVDVTSSLAAMQTSLQEGGGNFAHTIEGAASELRAGVAGLAAAANKISQSMHSDMATAQQTLRAQMDALATELVQRSRDSATQMNNETTTVLSSMQAAFTSVNQRLNDMSEALKNNGHALELHYTNVNQAAASTGKAAQVLEQASGKLNAVVIPMSNGVSGLDTTLKSLQQESAAVGGNIRQAQDAIRQASQSLEQNWKMHVDRFQGIDEGLARALEVVAQNLDSNTTQVAQYVAQVDQSLGKAASALDESIQALDEIFRDYLPAMRIASKR